MAAFGHLILYGRSGGPTDPLSVATQSPIRAMTPVSLTRVLGDAPRRAHG